MKTLEECKLEIATEEGFSSWFQLIKSFDLSLGEKIHTIDRCMKQYAKQVAEQTLKDAADKYKGITMKDDFGCICDVQNAILSTPIVTP